MQRALPSMVRIITWCWQPKPVVPAAELVIDNAAGTVSLDATVNTVVDYSFRVEGTDANGDAIGLANSTSGSG
jgi:hypothetical protein